MFDSFIKAIASLLPIILSSVNRFLSLTHTSTDELSFKDVVIWFRNRKVLIESDKDNIAFTLINKEEENIVLVIGIFNKKADEILDAEQIVAKRLDDKLLEAHRNNDLVLYE